MTKSKKNNWKYQMYYLSVSKNKNMFYVNDIPLF